MSIYKSDKMVLLCSNYRALHRQNN